jgi:hypothetical protein
VAATGPGWTGEEGPCRACSAPAPVTLQAFCERESVHAGGWADADGKHLPCEFGKVGNWELVVASCAAVQSGLLANAVQQNSVLTGSCGNESYSRTTLYPRSSGCSCAPVEISSSTYLLLNWAQAECAQRPLCPRAYTPHKI